MNNTRNIVLIFVSLIAIHRCGPEEEKSFCGRQADGEIGICKDPDVSLNRIKDSCLCPKECSTYKESEFCFARDTSQRVCNMHITATLSINLSLINWYEIRRAFGKHWIFNVYFHPEGALAKGQLDSTALNKITVSDDAVGAISHGLEDAVLVQVIVTKMFTEHSAIIPPGKNAISDKSGKIEKFVKMYGGFKMNKNSVHKLFFYTSITLMVFFTTVCQDPEPAPTSNQVQFDIRLPSQGSVEFWVADASGREINELNGTNVDEKCTKLPKNVLETTRCKKHNVPFHSFIRTKTSIESSPGIQFHLFFKLNEEDRAQIIQQHYTPEYRFKTPGEKGFEIFDY